LRSLACSFSSTTPEPKERLLAVFVITDTSFTKLGTRLALIIALFTKGKAILGKQSEQQTTGKTRKNDKKEGKVMKFTEFIDN